MKRILHLADLHLGETATIAKQVHIDPETGINIATLDTIRAIREIVKQAGHLDGVVIAGDVFDRPRPTPSELRIAADLFRFLADRSACKSILVIPGNHDMTSSPSDATACTPLGWLPEVKMVEQPDIIEYAGIKFGCLPYPRKAAIRETAGMEDVSTVEALSSALTTIALGMRTEGAQVLLAHCSVGGATVSRQPRPLNGDIELAAEALDAYPAILLGHIHKQQKPRAGLNAWYSGSPIVQDFGEEGETKGGIVWEFDGETATPSPIEVFTRNWITFDLQPGDKISNLNAEDVYRIRGELSHDEIQDIRDFLASARSKGAFIQDELRVQQENRARDSEINQDLDDDSILRRALLTREIPEDQHKGLIELHVEVQQGV